jgi:DNA modification methylase
MTKITWKTEKRLVKDLVPYPNNPRQISKEQMKDLKDSIKKFDYVEIVAIQPDNQIIAGHMRIKALVELGRGNNEIDVRVPNRKLDEGEMQEYVIRSNKNTGEWDWDTLANQFNPYDLVTWGFDPDELLEGIGDWNASTEPQKPDEEVLEPPKDPKTKLGDRYVLDSSVLVCGDSTNSDFVSDCLRDQIPILMVTDPPYGVNYDVSWRKHIKEKLGVAGRGVGKVLNDGRINWSEAWALFPGSVAYIWHASLHTHDVYKSLVNAGFEIISQIIWAKQHFVLSRGDYHWQHELCWYAKKKGHNHNWQGSRKESTLWEIANLNAFGTNKDDERTAHSTQKPLECMCRPIRNNTSTGQGVYDPFLGSGTTLLACEQLGRKCYGIELEPAYCDITVQRWVNYRIKIGKDPRVIKNGTLCKDFT